MSWSTNLAGVTVEFVGRFFLLEMLEATQEVCTRMAPDLSC